MKTRIAIALVTIAGILGMMGCKPKETKLSGQIFIVTQGGDSIKLGDVEILLIEKAQAVSFLANKEPAVNGKIASAQQEFDVAKESSKNAYAAYKAKENLKYGDTTEIRSKF